MGMIFRSVGRGGACGPVRQVAEAGARVRTVPVLRSDRRRLRCRSLGARSSRSLEAALQAVKEAEVEAFLAHHVQEDPQIGHEKDGGSQREP